MSSLSQSILNFFGCICRFLLFFIFDFFLLQFFFCFAVFIFFTPRPRDLAVEGDSVSRSNPRSLRFTSIREWYNTICFFFSFFFFFLISFHSIHSHFVGVSVIIEKPPSRGIPRACSVAPTQSGSIRNEPIPFVNDELHRVSIECERKDTRSVNRKYTYGEKSHSKKDS